MNIYSFVSKSIVKEFLAVEKYSNYESFVSNGFIALTYNAQSYIAKKQLSISVIEDLCDETMNHYTSGSPYGRAVLNDLVFNQLILYNMIDGHMSYDAARLLVENQVLVISNSVEETYLKGSPGFLTNKGVKYYLSLDSNIFEIADRLERNYPNPKSFFSN